MFQRLQQLISGHICSIGTILGLILWRHQIYITYFAPRKGKSLRPCAGILLLAFGLTFVLKLGPSLFRILGLTLKSNRFWAGQSKYFVTRLLGRLIELLIGVCLSTYIVNTWYTLTIVSECLPARSCKYIPLTWILQGKFAVCPFLNNVGGSVYYEALCEDVFDLSPLFAVHFLFTTLAVFIFIMEKRLQRWKFTTTTVATTSTTTSQ